MPDIQGIKNKIKFAEKEDADEFKTILIDLEAIENKLKAKSGAVAN